MLTQTNQPSFKLPNPVTTPQNHFNTETSAPTTPTPTPKKNIVPPSSSKPEEGAALTEKIFRTPYAKREKDNKESKQLVENNDSQRGDHIAIDIREERKIGKQPKKISFLGPQADPAISQAEEVRKQIIGGSLIGAASSTLFAGAAIGAGVASTPLLATSLVGAGVGGLGVMAYQRSAAGYSKHIGTGGVDLSEKNKEMSAMQRTQAKKSYRLAQLELQRASHAHQQLMQSQDNKNLPEPSKAKRKELLHAITNQSRQALANAIGFAQACGYEKANSTVESMKEFIKQRLSAKSPHSPNTMNKSGEGLHEAWLNRTVAALILNGVFSLEDQRNPAGELLRYGLETLYSTGITRDRMRGVVGSVMGYTPAFGVGSAASAAMFEGGPARNQIELGVGLGIVSLFIGGGGELSGVFGKDLGQQYTRMPSRGEQEAHNTKLKHAFEFLTFMFGHTFADAVAAFLQDNKNFNLNALRVGSGALAAGATGLIRTQIDMAAVQGDAGAEAAWLNGDLLEKMPDMIASLKESHAAAAGGWLAQLYKNIVSGGMTSASPSRALLRAVIAFACLAPRVFGASPLTTADHNIKELADKIAKLSKNLGADPTNPALQSALKTAQQQLKEAQFLWQFFTDGLLGLWGVGVEVTKWLYDSPPPAPGSGRPIAVSEDDLAIVGVEKSKSEQSNDIGILGQLHQKLEEEETEEVFERGHKVLVQKGEKQYEVLAVDIEAQLVTVRDGKNTECWHISKQPVHSGPKYIGQVDSESVVIGSGTDGVDGKKATNNMGMLEAGEIVEKRNERYRILQRHDEGKSADFAILVVSRQAAQRAGEYSDDNKDHKSRSAYSPPITDAEVWVVVRHRRPEEIAPPSTPSFIPPLTATATPSQPGLLQTPLTGTQNNQPS